MANGGRIDYTVGFKVDQSGLNQIKANLTSIQQGTTKDFVGLKGLQDADKKLIEIKKTASDVEAALNRSFNSNLGTLNISKFNQELKKLDIKKVYTDFSQLGPVGQNAFRNITSQILTTNLQLKQTNKWLDEMAVTMSNSIKWGVTSSIWNNMTGAVEKAWSFAKKLDTSLNDIRIVTEKSADDMERYAIAANKAAKNLGQTTTQYTNASLIYYQQGLSDAEVQARTETTLKAANVTGQSAAEVSEQLTAVWNGYKVNAQEAELYVDKLSAVAATTAADLEELSTGMSKVASAANIMGVDIDQLNAQLATVVSVTRQAPESVGTAFKTIYARMGDIEAGLDTETTLGDYTEKMSEMGFNVLDINGKLKDMGSVIEEIGNKWTNLSREQQVALSQIMAGTRQYNNLLALFDNWDMYSKSIETSKNATGALQRQQDIYMESMEAHLQQLQTAGEGVYNALFNAEDFNPIIDSLTGVVSLFKNFVDAAGGAQGMLLLLGNTAVSVFSKQIASGLATTVSNFKTVKENAHQLQAEIEILSQYENANINDSRTRALIDMKRQVLDYDKIITAEERNQANEIIRQTNELYKQQDLLEKKKSQIQDVAFRYTGSEINLSNQQDRETLIQDIEGDINDFSHRLKTSLSGSKDNQNTLSSSIAEFEQLRKTLKNTQESQEAYHQSVLNVNEQIKFQRRDIGNLINTHKLSSEQQNKLIKSVQDYKQALQQSGTEGIKNAQVIAKAKDMHTAYIQVLKELIKDGKISVEALKGLRQETNNLSNAAENGKTRFNQLIDSIALKNTINNIVTATQSISQLSMAISSLQNIGSIWGNEDLEQGEKILQTIMSLSIAIPTLIGCYKGLSIEIGKKVSVQTAETAATELSAIANEEEATTSIQESVAETASATSSTAATAADFEEAAASTVATTADAGESATNIAETTSETASATSSAAAATADLGEAAASATATTANNAQTVAQEGVAGSATAAATAVQALKIASMAFLIVGVAVVATLSAINAANNANWSSQKKSAEAIIEKNNAIQEELDLNKKLYQNYKEIQSSYENGISSKEEMLSATEKLCEAYGIELSELDKLLGKYDEINGLIVEKRKEEAQEGLSSAEEEKKAAEGALIASAGLSGVSSGKISFSTGATSLDEGTILNDLSLFLGDKGMAMDSVLGLTEGFWEFQYGEIENAEDVLKLYDTLKLAQESLQQWYTADELAGSEAYLNLTEKIASLEEPVQKYKQAVDDVSKYSTELEALDIDLFNFNGLQDFEQKYNTIFKLFQEKYPQKTEEEIQALVNEYMNSASEASSKLLDKFSLSSDLINLFGEENKDKIFSKLDSLSEEDFNILATLNIDEIKSLDNLDYYIQKAKYLVEREKITLNITTSQDAIETLLEGKDLTDKQLESLQELEKEYPQLALIQDKTSKNYLERLIEIREALEQEKIANEENIRNLTISAIQNIEISADDTEFKNKLKEIAKQDYQVVVEIKADVQSDFDSVTGVMENLNDISSKIGENFIVAAEDIEELNDAFPGILAGIEFLENGTVQLNEEAVNAAMEAAKREVSADTYTTIQKLENQKIILEQKRDAAYQIANIATKLANGDIKLTEVQSDLNENLNILKTTNDEETAKAEQENAKNVAEQAIISSENMAQNFASAYKAMAEDSQRFAEIAKQNLIVATTGQGNTVSTWGDNFNTEWKAKNTETGTVATTSAELITYEDFNSADANYAQIAEAYTQLGDAYNESYNNITGKQAELLARSQDLFNKTSQIGANQKDLEYLDDEIDRYHDINIQLDDIAKKIERINKAQEHLVGADLIASQKQSLKLLEEEIKLRREKQKIQQAEAVELQGHLLADGVAFNEDGSVANYEKIMKQQMEKVTDAQIKAQRSGTDADKEAAEVAEKNYEAFKKNFERYEELRDDIEDLADEITDMMYEQISKKVEVFTAKLNVKLDTAQAQKEWKEFTNQLFVSTNDALAQITAQSDLLKSDRSIASKATSKYDKIVNEGMKAQALVEGTAEKGTTSVYATYSKELGKYIFDQAKWQEDMEAAQQEAQEATLQIIDDVDSLGETAIGLLEDTIAAEKEQLAIYDDMSSLLNHAMKLQELFVGEEDYDSKAKMYEEQAKVASEKTRTAKDRRQYALDNIDSYAEAYKEAKQKYDEAKANGDGDVTVLEKQLEITKQAYEDMKNELKESTEDFYTSIEEQIEIAKNAYINTINKAMADMENKMTGGKGLSYISDEWDLINKNADRYLDTVNSTYEVQSLEAKYRKAIDSTSSLSAQKKLNKAMEEELKALQEKDKLSQYDIDRANKKYEITMKQIALEEAQANKSSMRLRRDAQGNYSYQFVADENATAEVQQELLALQNELYNFDKERYQQTLDDALAAYQEYQQKMLEAAQINDPEKRAEMEKLITEQYQEYLLAITADNEVAKQNLQSSTMEALQGMYNVNSENFDIMTKGMFEDFKDADGNIKIDFQNLTETELSALMGDLVTGWDGSVQSMIDKIADPGPDGFKEQSKLAFETAKEAAKTLDDTLTTLGNNFSGEGNTADKILNDVKDINDKMKTFETEVLVPTIEEGQKELPDAWATYKTGVENAATAINTLIGKLMGAYTNASNLAKKLQDIASQSPINVDINYNTTGDATTPSGNYSSGGGKTGGQPEEKEDPWIGRTITWKGKVRPFLFYMGNKEKRYFSDEQIWGSDIVNAWRGGAATAEQAKKENPVSWEILADAQTINSNNKPGYQVKNTKTGITGFIEKKDIDRFDTGGYTGEWGAEGRMAMLHEKEIVLNKQDTTNILNAVSIVRGIGDLINNLSANLLGNLSQRAIDSTLGMRDFEQNVHITAEFPNVSSSSEIEDALRNLTNVAAQRAFNTRI